jgi:hypothetical protein
MAFFRLSPLLALLSDTSSSLSLSALGVVGVHNLGPPGFPFAFGFNMADDVRNFSGWRGSAEDDVLRDLM